MKYIFIFLTCVMTYTAQGAESFVFKWDTRLRHWSSIDSRIIVLPLIESGNYDFTVDWGDGSQDHITSYSQSEIQHNYSEPGEYTVTCTGKLEGLSFENIGEGLSENIRDDLFYKITEIKAWGNIKILAHSAFMRCRNLEITATDDLDITGMTSFKNFFRGTKDVSGIANIGSWDVSGVTDMSGMFAYTRFSGDISSWDVSGVTNMACMFSHSSFSGDISSWDVSGVTNMACMFEDSSFSGDISSWDVSGVTTMAYMFRDSSFSGDISSWDVSSVRVMNFMFGYSRFFGDISSWDISSVTHMYNFLTGTRLPSSIYDKLLVSWANQTVNSWIGFDGGGSQYFSEEANAARQKLIGNSRWFIHDGGRAAAPTLLVQFITSDSGHLRRGFKSGDFESSLVRKGQSASPPYVVANEGWIFTGWSGDISNITSDTVFYAQFVEDNIEPFVERFYQYSLNRFADESGLAHWSRLLKTKIAGGADIARGFILSQEFADRNLDNENYLNVLYKVFFNRDPDSEGKSNWLLLMQNGMTRQEVLEAFIGSQEFKNLTNSFGILIESDGIAQFVNRFYLYCLNREGDESGLNHWGFDLRHKLKSGADVAKGFIWSSEFGHSNKSDEEFLNVLYRAFFDRDPDPTGYNNWLDQLNSGVHRSYILDGFIGAVEFHNLCAEYGIAAEFNLSELSTEIIKTSQPNRDLQKNTQKVIHEHEVLSPFDLRYEQEHLSRSGSLPFDESLPGFLNFGFLNFDLSLNSKFIAEVSLVDQMPLIVYINKGENHVQSIDEKTLEIFIPNFKDGWELRFEEYLTSLGYDILFINFKDANVGI